MGAPGAKAARLTARLTAGERATLACLAEFRDGERLSAAEVTRGTGLHTADEMLRHLRELGLAASRRIAGFGNVLWWSITPGGLEALDLHRWREWSIMVMERDLRPRLSSAGWAYAHSYARWRLHLTERLVRDRGLPKAECELIREMVARYVDSGPDPLTERQGVARVGPATPTDPVGGTR